VVVITGDLDPERTKEWVRKYFGPIPAGKKTEIPDLSEPRQEEEKFFSKEDKLATQPALAFSYHMPERNTPEYYAMGLLDQMLLQGENSRLFIALVKQKGLTGSVDGGINMLGNMFDYNGPMLWTGYLFHDNNVSSDSIMQVVDSVINNVIENIVDNREIEMAITKFRSGFYNGLSDLYSAGTANLLACFALFDDDPGLINSVEKNFRSVSPDLVRKTAEEYLRSTNRTVLKIIPKAANQ
jgi:predicted Zn-dependent peptidase